MIGEDLEVDETGVGNTVVRPVGVDPAAEVTGIVVVEVTRVVLFVVVVLFAVDVEVLGVVVPAVVVAVPWTHCE